ncbi:MAG: IS256 family transposase [Verrucomicrobia bacterium]|nr:IS256 family transposase [Verrucomicrobiota bacterium]
MENVSLATYLAQAEDCEVAEAFGSFMHTAARTAFMAVLFEEVEALCGKAYHPLSEGDFKRAGSAPGRYFFGTDECPIQKPRVRKHKNGKSEEVRLQSYEAGQSRGSLHDTMLRAFMAGIPSREQARVFNNASGTSPGEVSRLWKKEGLRCIEELRNRDLGMEDYVVLMLDGIWLADDLCAVVALGITVGGEKHILDFQIGSSENTEVCIDLLNRIEERGFKPRRRLLAVTDGSKALRKGVRRKWPDAIVQRCLIHKERNIRGYLSYRHHPELKQLFSRLRKAEGIEAAEECEGKLRKFLEGKSAQALVSLEEAGDELLAVHRLGAPSTLNKTLLNTNCIENPFRNVRAKLRRVSRWRPETQMVPRWMAYSLLEAERGFRRINGYADLPKLAKILESISPPPPEEGEKASPSPSSLDSKPSTEYKP